MPDYDDDDYDDDDVEPDQKPEREGKEWAELRRTKKERDKAKDELNLLKREKAFMKAGIDPDDPRLSYFVKGYEGDIAPEAIKAEAIKAGFLQEQVEHVDESPVQAQARIQAAANDGAGAMQVDIAALDQAFTSGGSDGVVAHLQQIGIPITYGE